MKRQARQLTYQREGGAFGPRRCIPDLEGPVTASRDDEDPVGADGAASTPPVWPVRVGALGSRGCVPDLESLIPACRNNNSSVGADRGRH